MTSLATHSWQKNKKEVLLLIISSLHHLCAFKAAKSVETNKKMGLNKWEADFEPR